MKCALHGSCKSDLMRNGRKICFAELNMEKKKD